MKKNILLFLKKVRRYRNQGLFFVVVILLSALPLKDIDAAYPNISGVTVSNITAQGATVSWTTDIPATSLVDFGTSTAYGTTVGDDGDLVTNHSVVLTGLFPLTTHYFQVRSADGGGDESINDNGGSGHTVTTSAAPVISDVRLTYVDDNQAIVTFKTDIAAYPYVGYGLTDQLGSLVGDEENFGVNHTITIYGLTPGRQYYFKPRVGDVYKNYTYYPNNNLFTTSGPYLQSVTTTSSDGTYGPGDQVEIVATYQENVDSGNAEVTITLNTGVQMTLNQASGNTLTGTYVVGVTGSEQNVSSLAVESIDSQRVCDSDGFCYRGTTLPETNINESSSIVIDTTAPAFSNIAPVDVWPNAFNDITTGSDISYTVSENLQSGTISFLRSGGTADPGSPHVCTLTGDALLYGEHSGFNMTNCVEGAPSLVNDATYIIRFEGTDLHGNNASRYETTAKRYDNSVPSLTSFTSSTPNGTYGSGSNITIFAGFDESPNVRGSMNVLLDTGVEVTMTYNGIENVIKGTYTVGDLDSGQYSEDLNVSQVTYMNVRDIAGNTTTDTNMSGVSGNNLADNSDIKVDTEAADAPSLVELLTNPINTSNENNITLRVEGEINTTIHYIIDDTNGGTVPITGSIAMEGDGSTDIAGINASSLADGTIYASAQLEKQNGEFSSFAQGTAIKDTDIPGWYMQYYADSNFTQSLGNNPRLSPGTYYIRVSFSEGEALDEAEPLPRMVIDAQGTLNDVNLSPLEKVTSNVYRFERTIVEEVGIDGSILEDLYIDSLTDEYGNTNTNVNPHYESLEAAYTDTVKPTVTGSVTPEYTSEGFVNVSLVFSEAMKESVAPTVRLRKNGGTFLNVNGSFNSSTEWSGSVEIFEGDANGPAELQVSGAQDRAGNVIDADEEVFSFFLDTQEPEIATNLGTDIGPVQTDTVNLTVVDGGTLSSGIVLRQYGFSTDNVCNEGDSYADTFVDSISFDITGDETRFLCAKAEDRAGNTGYDIIGKLNVDNTAPEVYSVTSETTSGSYKVGDVVSIRVNFSESVTSSGEVTVVLETGDVDRSCTMSIYESDYGTCDYIVQEGDISSDLNQISISGVVEDLAGNVLTDFEPETNLSQNKNIVIDTQAPTLEIIAPLEGSAVSGSTIVSFTNDEPVLSQCSFNGTDWSNCASDATALENITGWDDLPEGYINLYVKDTDLAGNTGTYVENNIIKDTNFPVVSDVTADKLNGYYKEGTEIPLILTFSREVTTTGNGIVTLETGSVDRSCEFSVTDSITAECTYTVQSGDISSDLNVKSVTGDIRDSVGNLLESSTPVINLADNKDIAIDTVSPIVNSVTSTHLDGTFGAGEEIDITLNFSEQVTSSEIVVNLNSGGSCTINMSTESSSGTCTYTVLEGENTLDLATDSISGTILDRAGNAVTNFTPGQRLSSTKAIKIDTTPSGGPIVQSVTSNKANGEYTVGEEIPVTVNFSETVIVTGSITVTFETGDIDRTCSITSGDVSGQSSGECTYTVRELDVADDLSVISVEGSVYDVMNNPLANTSPVQNLDATKDIIIDTQSPNPPSITIETDPITDTNKANVSISGTGEENASIQYSIDDQNILTQAKTGQGSVDGLGNISLMGIDLTGLDGGVITASVTLTDTAGNTGDPGIDTVTSSSYLPTITSITSNKEDGIYAVGEEVDIRVNFSKQVSSSGDVTATLETGDVDRECVFTLSSQSVGVCTYVVQSGDISSDLNVKSVSGNIEDSWGNEMVNFSISSNLAENKDIAIDTIAPLAPNIAMTNPINDSNKSDVIISGTGEASTNITYSIDDEDGETPAIEGTGVVSETGTIFLSNIDLTGLNGGIITASVTLTDLAGNESSVSQVTATSLIAFPTINSITSPMSDGYYKAGDTIDILLQFSENVTSDGDVVLEFETGENDAQCVFSVNDSNEAICNYTISEGENSDDLDIKSISGSIADQAGNPMVSYIPTTTLAQNKDFIVDTILIELLSFSSTTADGIYGPESEIDITATYSEPIASGAVVVFEMDTGAEVTLDEIDDAENFVMNGIYSVGVSGSGEGSQDLRVNTIESQNVCDLAGNCLTTRGLPDTNIDTNSNIAIDAISPVFSEILPENSQNIESVTTDSNISYTLSEDLISGDITFSRTAWEEDPNSPHICTLVGEYLEAGIHESFDTTNCESGPIELVSGSVYSVTFNGSDAYGNNAREVLRTGVSYGLDTTPPVISSVSVEDITSVSARVVWTTNEPADSFVDFGAGGEYLNLRGDSSVYSTEHSVLLDGLDPGTEYIFRVRSFDETLNESEDDNEGNGYTFTTQNLPSVTQTDVSDITFETARISWSTDTSVYSYLSYGDSGSYGKSVGDDSNLLTEQTVQIEDLQENTQYFYVIKMRDVYGNFSLSEEYSFTTAIDPTDKEPPVISDISVANITDQSAELRWTTDELSNSYVEFGSNEELGDIFGSETLATQHSVTLPAILEPRTFYYFRVISADANDNRTYSEIDAFLTLAESADGGDGAGEEDGAGVDDGSGDGDIDFGDPDEPVSISNIDVENTTSSSVKMSFTTNKPTNGSVRYGFSDEYGSSVSEDGSLDEKQNFSEEHEIVLQGLLSNVEYHFKVVAYDAFGNIGSSNDETFETLGLSSISGVSVGGITLNSATITWETAEPTTSELDYGTTTNYGESIENDDLTNFHRVELSDLLPGQEYNFRIRGLREDESVVSSDNYVFATYPEPEVLGYEIERVTDTSAIVK